MEFLYLLAKIRIPILDELMLLITRLGEETTFLAIGIILFWCVDKYQGYYLMGVGLFGNLCNQFLKILCRVPRPWVIDPAFQPLEGSKEAATGYSFPSGHSQTAVGTFGCLATTQKRSVIRWICVAIMVLVPFSRMYLGVHTPADVLVGSAMALVMVFGFRPLLLGNGKKNIPWVFAGMLVLSAAFLVWLRFFFHGATTAVVDHNYESAAKNAYTFVGCFTGLLIVWFVDEKWLHFDTKAVWWAQLIKAVLGLGLVLGVKEGMRPVLESFLPVMPARAVRYCLIVLVAGIVWPLSFRFFGKLGQKKS